MLTSFGAIQSIGRNALSIFSVVWLLVPASATSAQAPDSHSAGGGHFNTATNNYATVPGGLDNSAKGVASFAAGHAAKANHDGTFVWNDRSITTGNDSLVSTGEN